MTLAVRGESTEALAVAPAGAGPALTPPSQAGTASAAATGVTALAVQFEVQIGLPSVEAPNQAHGGPGMSLSFKLLEHIFDSSAFESLAV